MTGLVGKLGDRLVERLVPKTTAAANIGPTSERFVPCYCIDFTCWWAGNWCYIVGGITHCNTGCRDTQYGCCA